MKAKDKGRTALPLSHTQAMQRALRAIGAWEAHDEENREQHARAMRTLLRDAANDRTGDLTLTAVSDLLDDHYGLLAASGQPGIDVFDALRAVTATAHRLSGAFKRDVRARLRVSIDVEIPAPTPDEMKDLKAIIDAEGPTFANEVFAVVFDTAFSFTSANVHEVPPPPLNLLGSKRPLRQLPPLPPIPSFKSPLPREEAWELVVGTTSLFVELALRGEQAQEVATEDADNALAYMRVAGLGEYADSLAQWLAEAV